MTAVETDCPHPCSDDTTADASDGGGADDMRGRLTGRLRCASLLDCSRAVACSDDAMTLLRRVLGQRRPL